MSALQCGEFHELVSAFVDESLEGPELLRLEAHLAGCPGCRAFERELRRFGELLQAAEAFRPLRRPPSGFAAAVATRAVAEARTVAFPVPAAARGRFRVAGLGMAAAAAAAALLFAWSWQRLLPGDAEQRQAARPPAVAVVAAAADEGSMDAWVREHAMVARDGTLLGPAEEVEFASFRAAADGR